MSRIHCMVVLRFITGMAVDIVESVSERQAVADFAMRCLSTGGHDLPLLESKTAVIPDEVMQRLGANSQKLLEAPRPVLSLLALQSTMRNYGKRVITGASAEVLAVAKKDITRFFDEHGITLEF